MKTLNKIILAVVLGGVLNLSGVAQPSGSTSPISQPPASSTDTSKQPVPLTGASDPTCAYMLVPNPNIPAAKAVRMVVACTPEMMKNDRRCQQICLD